jgi:hypothetical protein
MHKPNKTLIPSRSERSHRRSLPELGAIEKLIDQTRALRLEFCRLAALEPIAESARAGAEALTQVGLALEKIAELLVSAQAPRKRSHHRKPLTQTPTFPSLEKDELKCQEQ